MTIDRPSAATPEEVLTKWQREHILDKGGIPTRHELLDLGRRCVDAAYEDAAKAVEGLHAYTDDPNYYGHACTSQEEHDLYDAIAAAIRALIGGGE